MNDKVFQVYDTLTKRSLNISNRLTMEFINGLFHKNYKNPDLIERMETEQITRDNRKISMDILIKAEDRKYHIEMQSYDDESIVLRVFEYGYEEAMKNKILENGKLEVEFPEQAVVYLHRDKSPGKLEVSVKFPDGFSHSYITPTYQVLQYSPMQLVSDHMTVLLPFELIKMRGDMEKVQTGKMKEEDFLMHYKMVINETINALDFAVKNGNINKIEYNELGSILLDLNNHLYGKNESIKKKGADHMLAERELLWSEKVREQGIQQGMQKGMQQGMQKGMQQGMQKGMQQGMQKGMQQGVVLSAQKYIDKTKASIESAVEIFDLNEEQKKQLVPAQEKKEFVSKEVKKSSPCRAGDKIRS